MLVLITYDVCTATPAGRRRLRQVAKQCVNYGQRVQDSVFECKLDEAMFVEVRALLLDIIDPKEDSLRVYRLGNRYHDKVEHYGVKPGYDVDGLLLL